MSRFNAAVLGAAAAVVGSATSAMAAVTYTQPDVTLTEIIDTGDFGIAMANLGGPALAVAFGIGGGFFVAKKAYAWVKGKM